MDSNDRTMNELIPFMDLHPELKLVPTTCTSVNIRSRPLKRLLSTVIQ